MHTAIIIIIIVVILGIQVKVFGSSLEKIKSLYSLFPEDSSEKLSVYKISSTSIICDKERITSKKNKIDKITDEIKSQKMNLSLYGGRSDIDDDARRICEKSVKRIAALENSLKDWEGLSVELEDKSAFGKIVKAINNYLSKNENAVCDFQLLKDIVDRNCDMDDEEVQTQIPVPLYLGLSGTMLGILVGVGYLVFSHGLDALLNASDMTQGSDGITALLEGVALAMICSIAGIIMTTWGSWKHKTAKAKLEVGKHDFLSWVQAELLPKLSTDLSSAMAKMTMNLTEFNNTFHTNAEELKNALSEVRKTSRDQAKIISGINDLDVKRLATANIQVYEKLKDCSQEIGFLGEYLSGVNEYLVTVRELSQKLDDANERTKMIEEMANFFKNERGNINAVQELINKRLIQSEQQQADIFDEYKKNISREYDALIKHLAKQRERLESSIADQDKVINRRVDEISKLVAEIQNLQDVKKSMKNLESATKEQTKTISSLVSSIESLVNVKIPSGPSGAYPSDRPKSKVAKILLYVAGSLISITCLIHIMSFIFAII